MLRQLFAPRNLLARNPLFTLPTLATPTHASVATPAFLDHRFYAKSRYNKFKPKPKKVKAVPLVSIRSIKPEDLIYKGKRKRAVLKPKQFDFILLKDVKNVGVEGQIVMLETKKGNRLVEKKKAVFKTAENVKLLLEDKGEEYQKLVAKRAETYKLRVTLTHAALMFRRYAPGPRKELVLPISKTDIVNRAWNVLKVALREEDISIEADMPNLKKPGLYLCQVEIGDSTTAPLRVYVKQNTSLHWEW